MKETAERLVRIDPRWDEVRAVDRLEEEAAMMRARGWWYAGSRVDALFENVVLFFEREVDGTAPSSTDETA